MTESPLLSIVITTYTDARLNDIYDLLKSIKNQTYSNTETLFIVERSKELMEKIRSYGIDNKIPNLNLLFNSGEPGLSAARNIGIKQAKGDIIAFVDDDVLLFTDWAENMVKAYKDDSIIGVTGPAIPLWEDPSMAWFPEEFYWIISCTAWNSGDHIKEIRNAWGMNMSFKREAFGKGLLFNNEYGLRNSSRNRWVDPPSEDVDFSIRIKEQSKKIIIYNPTVRLQHRAYKYRLQQKFIRQRSFSVGYQRRMITRIYSRINGNTQVLAPETVLLKRILTRLLPSIFVDIFTKPSYSFRRLRVTFTSLVFVMMGYGFSYIST